MQQGSNCERYGRKAEQFKPLCRQQPKVRHQPQRHAENQHAELASRVGVAESLDEHATSYRNAANAQSEYHPGSVEELSRNQVAQENSKRENSHCRYNLQNSLPHLRPRPDLPGGQVIHPLLR